MISTTKSLVCTLCWMFFYFSVEIASLTVDDQLVPEDVFHSPDGEDIKRANSFMPMRGRRDDFEEDKRASSFQPMRGKKEFLDTSYAEDKRASSFMPMRGRKSMYGEGGPLMTLEEEEKRSSYGFVPVRGRREEEEKRAASFMPMRGRKSDMEEVKRAASFMPMRGRKNSMSGKRVGFLPMRGKKDEDDLEDELESSSDEVRRALEALASAGKVVTQEDKRGSNFFAMRGKRETKNHEHKVSSKRETMFFPSRGKRSTGISDVQ